MKRRRIKEKWSWEAARRVSRELAPYGKVYRGRLFLALGLITLAMAGTLIAPNLLSVLTDLVLAGVGETMDWKGFLTLMALVAGLYGLVALCEYSQGVTLVRLTQDFAKSLRQQVMEKVNRLPLKYFDQVTTGETLSHITNEVDTISHTLNQSLGTIFSAGILFIGSLGIMTLTNGTLAFIAIGSTLVGMGMIMVITKYSQKYYMQMHSNIGKLNGYIEESYSGQSIIKIYDGEKRVAKEFDEINQRLYECAWKSQFCSSGMNGIIGFIGQMGYVLVAVVGGFLVMGGEITFGVIVAFMVYINLFSQSVMKLSQMVGSIQGIIAAGERIFAFLALDELEAEEQGATSLEHVRGEVEFKEVSFGYEKGKETIEQFSLLAKAGQRVAIVGPTGAGKTTIVNLLMRFYEVDQGRILVDGQDLRKMNRSAVRELFGMVLQDTWLLEGTIRENIRYNNTDVTDSEVEEICRRVGIHSFIQTLPKGYETILDDHLCLSEGQRQLITIARAMAKDAPMLILDEATSSIDTRTEVLVQKAMNELMNGRTAFIIAHRLSTIKKADIIVVMKQGQIVEQGNHKELLEQGGHYAQLYNSQFN